MELDENGQPITDPATNSKQPETNNGSQTIDMGDGNEITLDELKSGYMRQSDYTKKTQALAEDKKELTWEEALKAQIDELSSFKNTQLEKEELWNLLWSVNLSEAQLKMVQDLKKVNSDKSLLEIANDYWITEEAKLNNYKWSFNVKGWSFALPIKEEPYKVDLSNAGYNPEQAAKVAKMKF